MVAGRGRGSAGDDRRAGPGRARAAGRARAHPAAGDRNARTIVVYGLLAVAGAQLLYFLAVSRLDVGVALLIEYTAPVAVVLWMWAAAASARVR